MVERLHVIEKPAIFLPFRLCFCTMVMCCGFDFCMSHVIYAHAIPEFHEQPPKPRQKPRPTHAPSVSQQITTPVVPTATPTFAMDDSDSDVGMKDDDGEYTGEHQLTRLRRGKQLARRPGTPSDGSLSPQESKPRKRKATTALASTSKRKKTLDTKSPTPLSDPVRKYCYGKLLEVMEPIFLEHHSVEPESDAKPSEEVAKEMAANYVTQLENTVFDHYWEPDKKGARSAGPKYKERFRMLTFNLGHTDRVSLRKGIATGSITAANLAEMSSAELANEQAKQDMEKAAQEALHQSILKVQTSMPRAKITHKGEEIIESDVTSDIQRVGEEEERERVKMRLRVRTGSILDGNPESAASAGISSSVFGESRQMEVDNGTPISPEKTSYSPLAMQSRPIVSPLVTPVAAANPIASPTDITNPSPQTGPSFSLNALWSGTLDNTSAPRFSFSGVGDISSPIDGANDDEDVAMDLDDDDQPENQDFGMFLEGVDEKDPVSIQKSTTPPLPDNSRDKTESSPVVWTGDLIMPLDPKPALINKVNVRQVGGRRFGSSPTVWNQLFKSTKAVIDGRVPTDRSTKYLVTTRLNASKELIVVAFETSEGSPEKFTELFDFLINKDRHGLVFPWGAKPSSSAPGKDMYIIPLQASKPLPEFIDLLDHVQIPRKRVKNMLLGVFVLGKGKIVVPTPQPAVKSVESPAPVPAAPPPLSNDAISSLFSTLSTTAPPTMPYNVGAQAIPPMMPPMSSGPSYPFAPPVPMSAPPPPPIAAPPASDALTALTSSIKNMTPEQINLILKGLSMAGPPPPPPPSTQPSWPPPGVPVGNSGFPPIPLGPDSYPSPSRSPPRGPSRDFSRDDHYSRDRDRRASPPYRGGRGEPRYHPDRRERGRGSFDRRGGGPPPTDSGWERKRPAP